MRIFVVGATGILGHHLLPLLLNQGHNVCTIARTPEKIQTLRHSGIEVLEGDLLSEETGARLPEILASCEAAIHIATAIPANPAAPGAWDLTGKLRINGTLQLLQASLIAGVHRYIQQSIIMAYTDGGERWLDESTPFDASPERASVVRPVTIMENLLRATPTDKLHWTILRAGAFVGHGTSQMPLIEALRNGQVTIPCNGNFYQSYVHVADVASAILASLSHASAGSTLNITAEPVLYGTYVDQLADLLNVPHPLRRSDQPCPPSYRATSSAARDMLHWEANHNIYEDVR